MESRIRRLYPGFELTIIEYDICQENELSISDWHDVKYIFRIERLALKQYESQTVQNSTAEM